jgi:hypothetical protein
MPFAPGQSGNPSGWQGGRQRRHREVFDEIKSLGHRDALITLSTIQNNDNNDTELRIAAAAALAPYAHPKLQSIPTPRFIETPIEVPAEFTHVSDAENFLAKIAVLVARGHLDIQSAQELSGLVKAWIDTQYAKDELQFKINPPEQRDTVIRVTGGLPALPGTDITMPVLDHASSQPGINGHALAAPEPQAPQLPSTDSIPTNGQGSPTTDEDQGSA